MNKDTAALLGMVVVALALAGFTWWCDRALTINARRDEAQRLKRGTSDLNQPPRRRNREPLEVTLEREGAFL